MSQTDWRDALGALLPDDYKAEEPASESQEAQKHKPKLKVTLDRKRAGKVATIVSGFDADESRTEALAAELKRRLAVGGSSRGGEILIQGDRVQAVKTYLNSQGYKTC